MDTTLVSDAALVDACLEGDRQAFFQVVQRHQSLVCAVTYSATGDAEASEDLAQETFINAWRQLPTLREREKLRPWLCGIARNLADNFRRRRTRDLIHRSASLEDAEQIAAPESSALENAISREQQALVWTALEEMPLVYREPLVLFYREEQSVASVAEALGLNEDAVKQRLSRGRKLLKEQVSSLVEGTLSRRVPKEAFAAAVLAGLPAIVPQSAVAATVFAGITHGSAAAKALSVVAIAVAFVTPIIGIISAYIGLKNWMAQAKTPEQREFVKRYAWIFGSYMIGFHVLTAAVWLFWFKVLDPLHQPQAFLWTFVIMWSVYLAGLSVIVSFGNGCLKDSPCMKGFARRNFVTDSLNRTETT